MKLTTGQQAKKDRFEKTGKPGQICKLGSSNGCSSSHGNYHSTWMVFGGEPFRVDGDPRNAWNKFIREYGRDNVL